MKGFKHFLINEVTKTPLDIMEFFKESLNQSHTMSLKAKRFLDLVKYLDDKYYKSDKIRSFYDLEISMTSKLKRALVEKEIYDSLKYINEYASSLGATAILKSVKHLIEYSYQENAFKDFFKELASMKKYGEFSVLEESLTEQEYNDFVSSVEEMKPVARWYNSFFSQLKDYSKNLEYRINRHYTGSTETPIPSGTEILYHATIAADKILADGFKINQKSALGGATANAISFTANFNVAKEITRCFHEVVKIAKGEITLNDLMQLFEKEGIKDRIKLYRRFDDSTKNPKDVFELYRIYLGESKLRYDPLFFGTNKLKIFQL